jgi:hypothetical protein
MVAYSNSTAQADEVLVGSHRALMSLVLVGCLLFVALGAWMIVYHWDDPRAWIAGPLSVLVFGWFAWLSVLRMLSGYRTTINSKGITFAGPTFKPKLIPWDDIDAITVIKPAVNAYTGIRLKNYTPLISQFSEQEAKILLRRSSWMGRLTSAVAPIALVRSGMKEAIAATGSFPGLQAYFEGQRKAYGCDVLFAAVDRDRNAADFATYLEKLRAKYADHSRADATMVKTHA